MSPHSKKVYFFGESEAYSGVHVLTTEYIYGSFKLSWGYYSGKYILSGYSNLIAEVRDGTVVTAI